MRRGMRGAGTRTTDRVGRGRSGDERLLRWAVSSQGMRGWCGWLGGCRWPGGEHVTLPSPRVCGVSDDQSRDIYIEMSRTVMSRPGDSTLRDTRTLILARQCQATRLVCQCEPSCVVLRIWGLYLLSCPPLTLHTRVNVRSPPDSWAHDGCRH